MKKPYSLLLTIVLLLLIIFKMNSTVSAQVGGKWLGYWFVEDSIAELNGNTPDSYYAYLFPDTNVVACYPSNNCSNPYVHLIGNVLDPSSPDMQNILGYSYSNVIPYSVDSISLGYYYERHTGPGIVDTLIAYMWNDANPSDLPKYYYNGSIATYYGSDTLWMALLNYDVNGINNGTCMPLASPGALQTFKIPLTVTDTATAGGNPSYKVINALHFAVPAGKLVASAFGFKPDYSHTPFDTITTTKNSFAFISDAPNGGNAYAPYTKGDWNQSSIVENSVRYNYNQYGFYGFFMPTYAFLTPYQLQEHRISYFVSQAACNASFSITVDIGQQHHYIVTNDAYGTPPLRYAWNWGDSSPDDTIPYPTHTYADSGFYDICLTITDSTGCQSSFCDSSFHAMRTTNTMVYMTVVAPLVTATKEVKSPASQINIYPNPASDKIFINTGQAPGNSTITIFNMLGEILYKEQTNRKQETINCKSFPVGICFVQVSNESNRWVGKFVKE